MKTLLFFTISLFFGFQTFAQEVPKVIMSGKITNIEKKSISGVLIELKQKRKVITSILTSSNGKIKDLVVPFGAIYTVVISKKGFITKKIEMDLRYDSTKCNEENFLSTIFPVDIHIELDVINKKKKYSKELKKNFIVSRFYIHQDCYVSFDKKLSEEQKAKYNSWVK